MQRTLFGSKQAKVQAQSVAKGARSGPQALLPSQYKLVTGGAPRGGWKASSVEPLAPRGGW
jgi:hypothetical protein